ncbi:hypothetical protein QZM38_13860 [Burkholderia orbicola]|uniref:hypothetical protein n=1 Tax=Burkholderia orbicola TaxID=2978683 RepID=UPI0026533B53|nr:hypothetical protein [Burkholderia orbicola]MDN7481911.1 hypothetical protein [Burkholderia orbicola]
MKDRPIILIPVIPSAVIEKLEPLLKIVEEREKEWSAGMLELDRREDEAGKLVISGYLYRMQSFCDRVRRLHALATIAAGPFNVIDEDAEFIAQAERNAQPLWFDGLVNLARKKQG